MKRSSDLADSASASKRRMDEVLAVFPALLERLLQHASNLSGGER